MKHSNSESEHEITTKAVDTTESTPWYIRVASFFGIIAMYFLFGLICSLIGFAAYFVSKSKIGHVKAVVVTVVVAAIAKVVLLSLFT